jgi:stage II sporulation protein D
LSGVIESEGGGGRHIEYYKVQALMSRTYALKNKQRHKKDGFNVCDGVHCQAYHNKLRYTPSIRDAVEATEGVVLVDGNNRLVTSYFSANCGGQVCDASYVWNTSVPYVAPFIDTFCIHTRQATWTTSVDRYTWRNYLRDQFGVTEAKYGTLIYEFNATDRTAFYLHPSLGIPMRDLRHKFRLKSAYFSTRLENDNVIIEGRGFGHGVGLCQEGAMEMAKQGYDYTQIARFYFHNVSVLDARRSMFFEQVSTESDLGF